MINNLSGSITKNRYKLSWYINTKTKKGNILVQDTKSKTIRGTGLEETKRKTEMIEFDNKTQHLVYKNKYIKIHCVINKEVHMITEYINWEEIKNDYREAELIAEWIADGTDEGRES